MSVEYKDKILAKCEEESELRYDISFHELPNSIRDELLNEMESFYGVI